MWTRDPEFESSRIEIMRSDCTQENPRFPISVNSSYRNYEFSVLRKLAVGGIIRARSHVVRVRARKHPRVKEFGCVPLSEGISPLRYKNLPGSNAQISSSLQCESGAGTIILYHPAFSG